MRNPGPKYHRECPRKGESEQPGTGHSRTGAHVGDRRQARRLLGGPPASDEPDLAAGLWPEAFPKLRVRVRFPSAVPEAIAGAARRQAGNQR